MNDDTRILCVLHIHNCNLLLSHPVSKYYTLVNKFFSMGVWVEHSDTAVHVYWN